MHESRELERHTFLVETAGIELFHIAGSGTDEVRVQRFTYIKLIHEFDIHLCGRLCYSKCQLNTNPGIYYQQKAVVYTCLNVEVIKVSDVRHVHLDPSSLSPNLKQSKMSEETLLLSKLPLSSQTRQPNKSNDVLSVRYAHHPGGVSVLFVEVRGLVVHQGMDRVGVGRILDFFSSLPPPTPSTTTTVTLPSSVSLSQSYSSSLSSLMRLHVVCENLSFQFTSSINSNRTAAVLVVPHLRVIHRTPFSSSKHVYYDRLDPPSNRYKLIIEQCELGIVRDLTTSNVPVSSTSPFHSSVSSYWSERGFVSIAHQDILEFDLTLSTVPPLVTIHVAGDITLDTCADSLYLFYTLLHLWFSGTPSTKNTTVSANNNSNSVNNTNTDTSTKNNDNIDSNCEPNNIKTSAEVATEQSGIDNSAYVVLRIQHEQQHTLSSHSTNTPPSSSSFSSLTPVSGISSFLSSSEMFDQPYRIRWHVTPQHITILENYIPVEESSSQSEVFTLPSELPRPHVQFSLKNVTLRWNMRSGSDWKSGSSNGSGGRGPILMCVTLHKLCLLWAQFKESMASANSRRPVWRLQLTIGDIKVEDNVPTSSWKTFLCYDSKIPRQSAHNEMLTLLLHFDESTSSTSPSFVNSRIGTFKVVIPIYITPSFISVYRFTVGLSV